MKYFVVTHTYPNATSWKKHLPAHIAYLEKLLKEDKMLASGPFVNTPVKSAMFILKVANKEEALAIIAKDPYSIQNLIGQSTVSEWNPMFGQYQSFKNKILLKLGKALPKWETKIAVFGNNHFNLHPWYPLLYTKSTMPGTV